MVEQPNEAMCAEPAAGGVTWDLTVGTGMYHKRLGQKELLNTHNNALHALFGYE